MHRGEEHNSFKRRQSGQLSSPLYFRRYESPSHYLGRSKSPPCSLHMRDSSPNFLERCESPPRFSERRDSSPHLSERRESSPSRFERKESLSQFLERSLKSRSHSPSPDPRTLKFENVPRYLAETEVLPPHLETEEKKNHYNNLQKQPNKDDHQVAVSMSLSHKLKICTPSRIKPQQQLPKFLKNFKSLYQIDNMSTTKLAAMNLSGNYSKKIKALTETGVSFLEAKRRVLRNRFMKAVREGQVEYEEDGLSPMPSEHHVAQVSLSVSHESALSYTQFADKKPNSNKTNSVPKKRSGSKRPALEAGPSERPALEAGPSQQSEPKKPRFTGISEDIAVIPDGYPVVQLIPVEIKAVQQAIMSAYESLGNGPQVRFEKSQHRPGYLAVTCADKTSADWLKETVPQLRPWQNACLTTLREDIILKPARCSVFVPDEDGEKLPANRVLNRLQVGNKGLNCHLWTMLGADPTEEGVLWTFTIDLESQKVLRGLNMRPYFGFGTLNFQLQ